MKVPHFAAFGRVVSVLCVVPGFVVVCPPLGFGWQDDIPFASAECGCQCSSGSWDPSCPCSCGDCSSYGYCFSSPMSDELSRRMAAMARSMEASGLVYAPVATQFYQGVTKGGADREFEYGGKVDQFLILDSGKLGLWDGMKVTMHAETRFGQDVNLEAVGFAPVNVAMFYPNANEHDTAITGLTFSQALNDRVQAQFGKFNGLDLLYSLYPQTGRGVNGFMNASMVVPVSVARVFPLSFLGAGALVYNDERPQGGVLVYDTNNSTTTSGFDNLFDNGANILGFWRFFTDMNGLPGSHGFVGIWSTGEFVAFDPAGFVIVPDEGIVADRQSGAFTLLYILEQTLWMDYCNKDRNISLLSMWGIADEDTSPIGWSANIGIQAKGLSRARPHDSLGVGYFYTALSNDFKDLLNPPLELRDVHGVELYYGAAITPFFQLTANLQIIEPANVENDTAIVLGLRATVGM